MTQLFSVPVQSLDSDERYTPAWVFEHLGITFDLDPCSPVDGGDFVPTTHRYTRLDDGLARPWYGCVWVNPPFSNATAFGDKFREHGNGIFLGPIANARWSYDLISVADFVWLCRDFAFTHPVHAGKRSNMPLMFCSMGYKGSTALRDLALSGVHRGCLMRRVA